MDRGHCCQGIVQEPCEALRRNLGASNTTYWARTIPGAGPRSNPLSRDDPVVACATSISDCACQRLAHSCVHVHIFSFHEASQGTRVNMRTLARTSSSGREHGPCSLPPPPDDYKKHATWSTSKKRGWDRTPIYTSVMRKSNSGAFLNQSCHVLAVLTQSPSCRRDAVQLVGSWRPRG